MGLNGVSRMDRVRGDRANPQSVSLEEGLSVMVGLHCDRRGPSLYTREKWRPSKRQRGEGEGEAEETQGSKASPLFLLPKRRVLTE